MFTFGRKLFIQYRCNEVVGSKLCAEHIGASIDNSMLEHQIGTLAYAAAGFDAAPAPIIGPVNSGLSPAKHAKTADSEICAGCHAFAALE